MKVKKKGIGMLTSAALLFGLFGGAMPVSEQSRAHASGSSLSDKILLSPTMISRSEQGDATVLVNEQDAAGDPRSGAGNDTYGYWFGAWDPSPPTSGYPIQAIIDLGQPYKLTDVYVYSRVENNKTGLLKVYGGDVGNWGEVVSDALSATEETPDLTTGWKGHDISEQDVTSRYVMIEMLSFDAKISEIVLYGKAVPAKIELTPAMVTNESGYGSAIRLVDEQQTAGDPKYEAGGKPNRFWFGAWEDPYNTDSTSYPAYAVIDLGAAYRLADIYMYDFQDPGTWDDPDADPSLFTVYTGEPGNWTLQATESHTSGDTWKNQPLNGVETRYVRVGMSRLSAIMSEIVLYGAPASISDPPRIPLNLSMLSGAEAASALVDNQDIIDPLVGVKPSFDSLTKWNEWNGDAYINLGQPYRIESLYVADGAGDVWDYPNNQTKIHVSDNGIDGWIEVASESLNNWQAWNHHPVGKTAQYIWVQKNGGGDIAEIALYGEPVPVPILLEDVMIVEANGFSDEAALVDQQAVAGDPLAGYSSIGNVDAAVEHEVSVSSYPASAVIDLGHPHDITNIALLDGNGIAPDGYGLYVYAGEPGAWGTALLTDRLYNRGAWNTHPVSITTRYLRMEATHEQANFAEILVYGTRVGGAVADVNPPGAITNLSVTSAGSSSITLGWRAPGDNGTAGTAASYDVRYSTEEINETNWAETSSVVGAAAPKPAGSNEQLVVTGLVPETAYYLAIKTTDAAGNESGLSNVAVGTTIEVDVTAPASISDLASSYVSGNAVRLIWTATGDDGAVGTVEGYDIRYSKSPIDEAAWSTAQQTTHAPKTKVSGSQQAIWINNLDSGSDYYFAVKAIDETGNESALSNVVVTATKTLQSSAKLDLSKDMLINEIAHGEAGRLVDQQDGIDPRAGINGSFDVDDPLQRWELGSNTNYQPASVVIDLGVEAEITDVYIYDGNGGNQTLTLSVGDPFNWQSVATDSLTGWKQWNRHQMNVTSRYLQIHRTGNADILEVAVYGALLGEPEAKPEPVAHIKPKLNEMIGINAFIDDPLEKMQVAGFVREYHNWNWNEGDVWPFGTIATSYPGYPNNENKFNPSYAGGGWNFDAYYTMLKNAGITVAPAIQGSVSWLSSASNYKPVSSGEDPLDPATYLEHADHLFQYAARYGNVAVPDVLLKLAADQPRRSGLGLLNYYENWNEQNKWWEGRNGYFTPYEYAAMTSADYDGHQGALGHTVGIKNVDPNVKLVMGGLANPAETPTQEFDANSHPMLDYVKALKFWSQWNRGGDVPVDVINIHHYSLSPSLGTGISPESDKLEEKLKDYVDYRDRYLPGNEVWITEFGYDTHPESPLSAPEIGDYSREEVQGQWLTRAYLAAAAAGVDKAVMYMLRDVNEESKTKFDTSGLTGSKSSGWAPKTSWYYVYTLKNVLTDTRFEKKLNPETAGVNVYKFKTDTGSKEVYAIWSPTSSAVTLEDVEIALDGNPGNVQLLELENGSTRGAYSALAIAAGKISIDVSERPVFVVVANSPASHYVPSTDQPVFKVEKQNIIVELSVNEAGNGELTLSEAMLNDVLVAGESEVVVTLQGKSKRELKSGTVKLDKKLLDSLRKAGKNLRIATGVAEVRWPTKADGSLVSLTLALPNLQDLPQQAAELFDKRPVIDLNWSVESNTPGAGDERNEINAALRYDKGSGEQAHKLVVFRVEADGSATVVKNSWFDEKNGQVNFTANHPGLYGVGYIDAGFKDVTPGSWARESIEALAAREILQGKDSGQFDPLAQVTRAEFVTMLIRAFGWMLDSSRESAESVSFIDAVDGSWYSESLGLAAGLGIIRGRGDGTFGVDEAVTRQEMAIILQRAFDLPQSALAESSYRDLDGLPAEARNAILSLTERGLLNGFSDGSFQGAGHLTREQAAAVLYRALWGHQS